MVDPRVYLVIFGLVAFVAAILFLAKIYWRNQAKKAAMSDVKTDTFTDARDGKVYKCVEVGGKTWMAENLNYETEGSWCYDDDKGNGAKYGRLYTWEAARSACPEGWRLPTLREWCNCLVDEVGGPVAAGKNLKSKAGWKNGGNGVDAYGCAFTPGGFRHKEGCYDFIEESGFWWSDSDNEDTGEIFYLELDYRFDGVNIDSWDAENGFSVRYVKDGRLTIHPLQAMFPWPMSSEEYNK